jgi:fatty acid desaturase
MPALFTLSDARRAQESARAELAERAARQWRRSWRVVLVQCIGLTLLGYLGYGLSFGLTGDPARLAATGAFVVAYVVPLFRLLAFLLYHADQF